MARTTGISGLGLAAAAAGGFLVYSGVKGVPIAQGLRDLTSGRIPAGTPSPAAGGPGAVLGGTPAAGPASSGYNPRIAQAAMKYVGIPYRWGKANPADGFDCSGLVTWVLHHDLGYDLPSNTHTTSALFMIWRGAYTIPRASCSAGDLVCYAGHIGIAVDRDQMVNAPSAGKSVQVQRIWGAPIIRRVGTPAATGKAR